MVIAVIKIQKLLNINKLSSNSVCLFLVLSYEFV